MTDSRHNQKKSRSSKDVVESVSACLLLFALFFNLEMLLYRKYAF